MPSILNLKFKGNKSFVAFSNLGDAESLTKTWKVCTKVASYLEQGQRLENLSWRLWHLQNLMVDTDNAKSKREFKKLSKNMGDKRDKEKGRSIVELEAPDFKRNQSNEMIRQRAAEKERLREASQNTQPGTIQRMQFTFSVDQPAPATNTPVTKPDLRPAPQFNRQVRGAEPMVIIDESLTPSQSLKFPTYFSNDFGPAALLNPAPTLTNPVNYGEGLGGSASSNDAFSIVRPTIELALDEIIDSTSSSSSSSPPNDIDLDDDIEMAQSIPIHRDHIMTDNDSSSNDSDDEESETDLMSTTTLSSVPPISAATTQQQLKTLIEANQPKSIAPYRANAASPWFGNISRTSTPTGRPALTVKTQVTPPIKSSTTPLPTASRSGRGPTPTSNVNSAPGGVKAECSNCGATHTPLWRRGLNDELNCNACGLYCKLHKRPRPRSMRNQTGEGRSQNPPRQEAVDVMAQCYNCHTTATPLWRKDDEGKTVCNACGLYYKLHGSARPISMKSDVIRKRSRHDARRAAQQSAAAHILSTAIPMTGPETPSASPGVSRRTSPARESSPTLAPDSTTQMEYDYSSEHSSTGVFGGSTGSTSANDEFRPDAFNAHPFFGFGSAQLQQFPGPYNPDTLQHLLAMQLDPPLPFATADFDFGNFDTASVSSSRADDEVAVMSPRSNKRRRMSTDSESEPPSSAVSLSFSSSSYTDGYSTAASSAPSHSHSQRSSISSMMDFPFSSFPNYNDESIFKGPGAAANAFWSQSSAAHVAQNQAQGRSDSPQTSVHPPMLPPAEGMIAQEGPIDYQFNPHDDDGLFSAYIHPPMIPVDEPSSSSGAAGEASSSSNMNVGMHSVLNHQMWY